MSDNETTDRDIGLAILRAIVAASDDEDIGGGIARLLRRDDPWSAREVERMAVAAERVARAYLSGGNEQLIVALIKEIEEQRRQAV